MQISNFEKNNILIVGQYSGTGGVQTIHRDLLVALKKKGFSVYPIYSLKTFFKALLKTHFFSNTKIAFFSGLSLLFSPLFFKASKHIFFVHGYYVFEGNRSFIRLIKKFIYEIVISNLLLIYRWVYCIAPSPISSLVNSIKFNKEVSVVAWPASEEFLNFSLHNNKYKYHLTFLGRVTSQKINKEGVDNILKMINSSSIINDDEKINFAFLIPRYNKNMDLIKNYLEEKYNCSIDIFLDPDRYEICSLLSKTLFYFNCYEWEAFGLSTIEALCMGCNVIIPSTSPILPMIDNLNDSPVYKYHSNNLLNNKLFQNDIQLSNKRVNLEIVNYYRKLFGWDNFINEIFSKINY